MRSALAAVLSVSLSAGLPDAGKARAGTLVDGTATFTVSATITQGCWVVGNPTQTSNVGFGRLDFGTHPAIQAGLYDAVIGMAGSPAQVQCTPGTAATMSIDAGQNALGSQRRMRSGAHYVAYTLTTQPGGGTVLAPGVGVGVNASAGPTLVPVYGRATAPGSGLPSGVYTDTLQVVFSW